MIEEIQSKFDADKGNGFWDKIKRAELVRIVELDPPKTADATEFMECAEALKNSGVDIMTIADSPSGIPRIDSSLLACKVKRELGIETLPHLTCRDRNGIAMKALFMGLYADDVRNILIVTGDPAEGESETDYKSVFEYNSVTMTEEAIKINEEKPFRIFGALNVNAPNFDAEIERAKKKIDAGMCGFLTQPIFTEEAFDNVVRASKELEAFVFAGIMPIVSEKNARFMEANVPGIKVGEEVISKYVGKTREECNQIAVEMSLETAKKVATYVDGHYIMTPFMRTDIVCDILDGLNDEFNDY